METMGQQNRCADRPPVTEKLEDTSRRTPWRYTRLGSVFLSWDFYVGVPVGLLACSATLSSVEVRQMMPFLLVLIAGVGAALATLVLTSLTVLLSTISNDYRHLLDRMPSGTAGVATPFRIVIACAAVTTV